MTVLALLLGIAVVVLAVLTGVLASRLRALRTEVAELHAEVARREAVRAPKPVKAAGMVVRTVAEAASRVRERGVGGMLLASIDDFTRWATEDRSAIVRIAGPDGTVTVFFSDIEGSTSLNNELGDERWVRLLAAHDELVEKYVDRSHGHIVKTQGDGHMVVFSTPELALRAAVDIQLSLARVRTGALRRTPIRLRMGLHTGPAIEKGGDWFGQNVALAARIAAQADGGEVLVSGEVVERAGDAFTFVAGDEVPLKGFAEPVRLWRVELG